VHIKIGEFMTRSKIASYITFCTLILTAVPGNLLGFFHDNRQRAAQIIAQQDELDRQARIAAEKQRLDEQDARAWNNFCEMWSGDAGTIVGGICCGILGIGLVAAGGALIASIGSSPTHGKVR
jgi:hypothetical protein